MNNPPSILYNGHTIESACFFDTDIKQWHVRCFIIKPDGERSQPIACPCPPWTRDKREAERLAMRYGASIVQRGEW